MVEKVSTSVDGDAEGTYAPLSEAELAEVERLTALFLGPDQNRSAAAERALSALGLDYLPRLVAQVRALQRGVEVAVAPAERTPEMVLHAMIAVYGIGLCEAESVSNLLADYEARLSGARPLDAPPPGNRFPGGPPGEGAER